MRSIANFDKALQTEVFESWREHWECIRKERKAMEAGTAKAMRMLANSNSSLMNVCFDSWAKLMKQAKTKAANTQKVMRSIANSGEALQAAILAVWVDYQQKLRKERKAMEAGTAKALRMMANSNSSLMNVCFDSWAKLMKEEKKKERTQARAMRTIEKSTVELVTLIFNMWGKQVLKNKMDRIRGSFAELHGEQQQAIDALATHEAELSQSVTMKTKQIAQLGADIAMLRAEQQQGMASLSDCEANLASIVAARNAQIARLSTDVFSLQEEHEQGVAALAACEASLSDVVAASNAEIELLRTDLDTLKGESRAAAADRSEMDRIRDEIRSLAVREASITQIVSARSAQIAQFGADVASLQEEQKQGLASLTACESSLADIVSANNASGVEMESEISRLRDVPTMQEGQPQEVNTLASREINLTETVANRSAQISQLSNELDRLRTEHQQGLEALSACGDGLVEIVAARDATIEKLSTDLEGVLEQRLGDLSKDLQACDKALMESNADMEQLRAKERQMAAKDQELHQLRVDLQGVKQMHADASEELAMAQRQGREDILKIEELRADLTAMTKASLQSSSEMLELKEQLNNVASERDSIRMQLNGAEECLARNKEELSELVHTAVAQRKEMNTRLQDATLKIKDVMEEIQVQKVTLQQGKQECEEILRKTEAAELKCGEFERTSHVDGERSRKDREALKKICAEMDQTLQYIRGIDEAKEREIPTGAEAWSNTSRLMEQVRQAQEEREAGNRVHAELRRAQQNWDKKRSLAFGLRHAAAVDESLRAQVFSAWAYHAHSARIARDMAQARESSWTEGFTQRREEVEGLLRELREAKSKLREFESGKVDNGMKLDSLPQTPRKPLDAADRRTDRPESRIEKLEGKKVPVLPPTKPENRRPPSAPFPSRRVLPNGSNESALPTPMPQMRPASAYIAQHDAADRPVRPTRPSTGLRTQRQNTELNPVRPVKPPNGGRPQAPRPRPMSSGSDTAMQIRPDSPRSDGSLLVRPGSACSGAEMIIRPDSRCSIVSAATSNSISRLWDDEGETMWSAVPSVPLKRSLEFPDSLAQPVEASRLKSEIGADPSAKPAEGYGTNSDCASLTGPLPLAERSEVSRPASGRPESARGELRGMSPRTSRLNDNVVDAMVKSVMASLNK